MPDSEAKKRWMKENTVFVGLKLQKSTDADVIEFLKAKGNNNMTIKNALRILMEQEGFQSTEKPMRRREADTEQ